MYRLVEDETQQEILTATDLCGFFADPSAGESGSVIAIGASLRPEKLPISFEDVEFQVRDVQGQEIGSYYVGRIDVIGARYGEGSQGRIDLTISLGGYTLPYPYAGEIWRTWSHGPPVNSGVWKGLPAEAHESWLHVVQQVWFTSGHRAMIYGDATHYEIAGADLANIHSFYCALGEAVNGPGGYLGSTPSGLADCLSSSRGKRPEAFHLTWHDIDVSRRNIDRDELNWALEVMRDYGVDIEYPPTGLG
ncbi:barstar family protein [Streptomyces sp. NEAU-Y11]|uniref:barstar family protein n=1 Tax=Streptomyces cucumeris TaxID=2962890 RepID=UPI0020C83FA1|nr:barstar family protein [Streptomyces sp. NEAU-Y11]MCP9212619.1 barstar family protein [Streptomyces sp. NEAU-Y11]